MATRPNDAKPPGGEASDRERALTEQNAELAKQVAELQRMLEREREERRQLARQLAEPGPSSAEPVPSRSEVDSPCAREGAAGSEEAAPAVSSAETVVAVIRRWVLTQPDKTLYTWLDHNGEEQRSWTYRELQMRANAVCHALLHRWGCAQDDRAALMYMPGLDFIAGFWGCLFAGVIAVPVYPVDLRGGNFELEVERFGRIAADCEAKLVLSHGEYLGKKRLHAVKNMFGSASWPQGLEFQATDELEPRADCGTGYVPGSEQLAFLQFTSGSTGDSKGVMISHSSLAHNVHTMVTYVGPCDCHDRWVSWLPQYHDMGLIGQFITPAWAGANTVAMSPAIFLSKPGLWLSTVSRYKGTCIAGPNFAYQRCIDKFQDITKEHPMESLALGQLKFALNGAETIRSSTLKVFAQCYYDAGFKPSMWMTAFGLAENVVYVRGFPHQPAMLSVQCGALEAGLVAPGGEVADGGCVELVGCGVVSEIGSNIGVKIVNARKSAEAAPDQVAEIWVSGPSKAQGYWGKPELSQQTFQATIKDDPTGTEYLRTGDLGFIHQGELYICGRLKDLIIVRGKNYYPQDIERTAEASHKLLRPGCTAAFSVEAAGEEQLVVVAEVRGEPDEPTRQSVLGALRLAVARDYGLEVQAALLLRERTVFKTTSGKIRRRACKQGFLEWCERQQAARPLNQTGWTDVIRSGVLGLRELVLPGSSAAGVLNVVAHWVNMNEVASGFAFSGRDGAEVAFSDCLDNPGWDQADTTATDALVVGAGIVGLCFARDLASVGYSVVVLEKSEGIGGTWRTNDYPGLRLHQPGATYRCLSLAPDWTKHHDADEWYRPTREEILAYIEQLAAHPLITVMLNCEYLSRSKEHGQSSFVVSTSEVEVRSRFVFECTGCYIANCGAPRIPRELDKLHVGEMDGPRCFHSSQLSPEVFSRVVASDKVVLVGSGKAAIDLLQQLKPGQQTVWAHRGHTAFTKRQSFIDDFSQDGQIFRDAVIEFTSSCGLSHWSLAALEAGWLLSCEGPITARDVKYGGGVVDPVELEWADQFDQLDLSSIDAFEGGVTFRGTDKRPLEEVTVGPGDCIVLCTGQSNPWTGLPKLEPGYTKAIPFTIFSAACSALVPLCLALEHLRGATSRCHDILSGSLQGLEADAGFSSLTDARSIEMAVTDATYNRVIPHFFPTICKHNFASRHEWVEDWYGIDLDVEDTLRSWGCQSGVVRSTLQSCDALVAGAGIVGLCFARDLASVGYSVVVVEKSEGIGGIWRTNDYPGLRLHLPGATYRCLSLAPDWTKHHDADEWYRPTREEILAYIEQLAAHPLITVMLNCEYLSRSKEHGQSSFVVSTSEVEVRSRFVFECTGGHHEGNGAPRIPHELDALHAGRMDGPRCFHSSQLSPEVFSRVVASDKVVLVGSGKAAIDLLQQLKPGQQTVWAHRGHTAFMPRSRVVEDFSQDGQLFHYATLDFTARGRRYLDWPCAALEAGWLLSCEGPITAREGKFGGGIVDLEELEWADQFEQLDLRSIDAFEGGVTFRGTDKRPLEEVTVGPGDCIVLCTGQSNPWTGLPKLEPGYVKTVHFTPLSSACSALVPLCLALEHLRGATSRYYDILSGSLQGLEADPDFARLTDARLRAFEISRVAYGTILSRFFPAISEYNVPARHEWVEDWYGIDLNVEDTLRSWGVQLSNERAVDFLDPTSSSSGADRVAVSDYGHPKTKQMMVSPSLEAMKAIVHSQVCAKLSRQSISPEVSLQSVGLTSLKTAELASSLGTELGMAISTSVFYEYPTIASLAATLSEKADMADKVHSTLTFDITFVLSVLCMQGSPSQYGVFCQQLQDPTFIFATQTGEVIKRGQATAANYSTGYKPMCDGCRQNNELPWRPTAMELESYVAHTVNLDVLVKLGITDHMRQTLRYLFHVAAEFRSFKVQYYGFQCGTRSFVVELFDLVPEWYVHALQSELGVTAELPSTLTSDYPTVAAVTEHITSQFVFVRSMAEAYQPTLPAAEAGHPVVASGFGRLLLCPAQSDSTTASLPPMTTVLHKPVKLEQHELLPPLFMAAGGFGSSAAYYELASSLGGSRMVYGLDFEGSAPDALKQARIDAHSIQQVLPPGGKVHLGGLSSGGHTSFFTAILLQQAGFDVRCVFLLDPLDPSLFRMTDRLTLIRDLFVGAGVLPEHLEDALESPLEAFSAYPYLNRLFSAQKIYDYLDEKDLDVDVTSNPNTIEPLVGNAEVVYFYTELRMDGEAKVDSTEWAVEAPSHVTVPLPCNHAQVLSRPEAFSIVTSTMMDRMNSSECQDGTAEQPTAAPATQQDTSYPHSWSTGQVAGWVRALPGCASCVDWIEQNDIDGRKLAKILDEELDDLGAKRDFSYHFLKVRFKSLLKPCP